MGFRGYPAIMQALFMIYVMSATYIGCGSDSKKGRGNKSAIGPLEIKKNPEEKDRRERSPDVTDGPATPKKPQNLSEVDESSQNDTLEPSPSKEDDTPLPDEAVGTGDKKEDKMITITVRVGRFLCAKSNGDFLGFLVSSQKNPNLLRDFSAQEKKSFTDLSDSIKTEADVVSFKKRVCNDEKITAAEKKDGVLGGFIFGRRIFKSNQPKKDSESN